MLLNNIMEMDIFNVFNPSYGNTYIFVAINYVLKCVKTVALPTNDSKVVVKISKKHIFMRFGMSRAISDEGSHL